MNRRPKIIVTVTSIFIVLLALLGLTFAFFLTKIQGNKETKSISVTTANLLLEYKDGNGIVELTGLMPGQDIPSKTFTVTNRGSGTVENYKVYLENVQNQIERKDDLKYTLTCKSYKTTDTTVDFSTLTEDGKCTGATTTTFPSVMSVIATNSIDEGYTHRYELKVEYLYKELDQSIDMNKLVQAKVNIYDGNIKFLAAEIMNNVLANTGTKYVEPSMLGIEENTTKPAEQVSLENERILSYTMDDLGTSYYYRGNVEDNYVNFAGMCWKIVRIEGDGSIKLILEDRYTVCNDNETEITSDVYIGSWSDGNSYRFGLNERTIDFINYDEKDGLQSSFKTFQIALATKINANLTKTSTQEEINESLSSKLKIDEWCYDRNVTELKYFDNYHYEAQNPVEYGYTNEYYGAYTRIDKKNLSLKCLGKKLTKFKDETEMFVGTLIADEISFAGATNSQNHNYYLLNNFQKTKRISFWSLSPYYYDGSLKNDVIFYMYYSGILSYTLDYDNTQIHSRPAVTLKSGITATTNSDTVTYGEPGTQTNPYVIN